MVSSIYVKVAFVVVIIILVMTIALQRSQISDTQSKLDTSTALNKAQATTIVSMKQQNEKIAKLAVKFAKDYEDAQNENNKLERDIADSTKRVFVNASCNQSVPSESSATSMDDERSAELTRDAERNYLRLRNQITRVTAQVKGLQSYIKALPSECIAK